MTILVVGDIVGDVGMRALFAALRGLVRRVKASLVIANGENAAGGFGLTTELVERIQGFGVHVITSGNHIWQHCALERTLDTEERLLRPENYFTGAPGHGWCVATAGEDEVAVINLQGRHSLPQIRCPFQTADSLLGKLKDRTRLVIVDFHAESAEEKEALALHLDGRVSAVVGTHTHVQTADARVLPNGTGFMTDIGMTGPAASVIGFDAPTSIRRSLSQMPLKLTVAEGPAELHGVAIEVDTGTGHAISVIPQRVAVDPGLAGESAPPASRGRHDSRADDSFFESLDRT